MKTQYRILWVDDDVDSIETDLEDIKEFFENRGIEPLLMIELADDETNIHTKIESRLDDPDLDLIVVDFRMPGVNGSELISQIRRSDHIFLPVVFYSTVGTAELHRLAAEAALDGVYIADRRRVGFKVQEVAESLLRKEQTTKRTRGLLMEGTSEIDATFAQLFSIVWDELSDDQKDTLIGYLSDKLNDKCSNAERTRDSIPKDREEFFALMDANFVSAEYDTHTRWKVLKKAFAILGWKGNEVQTFNELYQTADASTPIMSLRNNYAHRTREQLRADHSEESCIDIRRKLRAQFDNMKKLVEGN